MSTLPSSKLSSTKQQKHDSISPRALPPNPGTLNHAHSIVIPTTIAPPLGSGLAAQPGRHGIQGSWEMIAG